VAAQAEIADPDAAQLRVVLVGNVERGPESGSRAALAISDPAQVSCGSYGATSGSR